MSTSSRVRLTDRYQRLLAALAFCVGAAYFATPARADDLGDFEQARKAYDAQDYPRAVSAFRAMVGTNPPRVTDRLLVLESRKYLAASLLFIREPNRAKEQFRLLLLQEPEYLLDPLAFPTEVLALFEQTKTELQLAAQAHIQQEQRRLEETLRARHNAEKQRQDNLSRLLRLAQHAEERQLNSRWVASLPFGIGQFQNGDSGLGVALAMSQGMAAALSGISFLAHQRLRGERPSPAQVDDTRHRETLWRTTNIASFAIFAGLAALGILDAHLRFVPERVRSVPRKLPPDLERWVKKQQP